MNSKLKINFILLLLCFVVLFACTVHAAPVTFNPQNCDGTLACYKFDEGDFTKVPTDDYMTVKDFSSNSINGKTYGVVQKAWSGFINGAAEFDGNKEGGGSLIKGLTSYIEFENPTAIENQLSSGSLSVSAWVYAEGITKTVPSFIFSVDNFRVGFAEDWSPIIWVPGQPSGTGSDSWRVFSQKASASIPTDKWVHVVWVYDSSDNSVSIRINGGDTLSMSNYTPPSGLGTSDNYLISIPSSVYLPATGVKAFIGGGSPDNSNLSLVGKLDEVRVYGKVLSDVEVDLLSYGKEKFSGTSMQSTGSTTESCLTLGRPDYVKTNTIKRTMRGEGDSALGGLTNLTGLGERIYSNEELSEFNTIVTGLMTKSNGHDIVKILEFDSQGSIVSELELNESSQGEDDGGKTLGLTSDDGFGYSMAAFRKESSGADGFPDLIIGSAAADDSGINDVGRISIVKLKKGSTGGVKLSSSYSISGHSVAQILGESGSNWLFGSSVHILDDSDPSAIKVAVGARGYGSKAGEVFILTIDDNSKTLSGTPMKLAASTTGLTLAQAESFGMSIVSVGDLDGDKVQDVAVAASNTSNMGALYVFFLNSDYTVKSFVKVTEGLQGFPRGIGGGNLFGRIGYINHVDGKSVELFVYPWNRDLVYKLTLNEKAYVTDYRVISDSLSGLKRPKIQFNTFFGHHGTVIKDVDGNGVNDIFVTAPDAYSKFPGKEKAGALYFLGLSSPSEYVEAGTYESLISKNPSTLWDKLFVNENVPSGTSAKYEILDSDCNKTLIGNASVTNGFIDLSNVDEEKSTFCLKVDFTTTDIKKTPQLCSYDILLGGSVVSGKAWYDVNENGIREDGEIGLLGVEVSLFDASDKFFYKVSTDAYGNYSFPPVSSGEYYVKFTPPSTPTFSFSPSGKGNYLTDSNVTDAANGITSKFTLGKHIEDDTIDAGLYVKGKKLSALGDYVWYDSNKDNKQSSGEFGILGVEVKLLDDSGKTVSKLRTDPNGKYSFEGVLPGSYALKFTAPWSGYKIVSANSGNDDEIDSDVSSNGMIEDIVISSSGKITVSGNEISDGLSLDAGFSSTQTLSAGVKGSVWLDEDEDGLRDSDERNLSGVLVEIYDFSTSTLLTRVLTEEGGEYAFKNLPPVSYYVKIYPSQYSAVIYRYGLTKKDVGSDESLDSDIDEVTYESPTLDLSSSTSTSTFKVIDAGLVLLSSRTSPSSLGDYAWLDKDENGVQDTGESGLQDLSVSLYDSRERHLSRVSTDSNGWYSFSHLPPGDYIIGAELPSGYYFTKQNASTDDDKDSDISVLTGMTGILSLDSGEDDPSVDIGLLRVGSHGLLGSVFQMLWDGQCSDDGKSGFDCVMGNYPAFYNTCATPVDVDVDFYTSDGSLKDSKTFELESGESLVLSVHDFKGFSRTSHGFLEFTQSTSDCLDGSMETLSWARVSGLILGYDAVPIHPLQESDCWVLFNTFNPSLNVQDWFIHTQNRLKISNNDSSERDFDVTYYNYSGKELSSTSEKISIKGKGVSEHSIDVSNMYGLVKISPSSAIDDISEGYGGYVYRPGRDKTTEDELRLNSFSMVNACLPSDDITKVLPITMQENRINWLELYNVTSNIRDLRVDVYSDDGGFLEGYVIPFTEYESFHLPVSEILASGKNGFAVVSSEGGGDFLSASTVYFYAPLLWDSPFGESNLFNNRVIASQSLMGLTPLLRTSGESKTLYNTHLSNDDANRFNWLRVFNHLPKSVEVTLVAHSPSRGKLSKKLSLPHGGSRYNLNVELDLPSSEMGKVVIEMESSDSLKLYGDLLRVDYADPLFSSVVDSESVPLR